MPYTIVEKEGRYCVALKENPKEIFGCHDTQEDAQQQIAAIEASESKNVDNIYEDYIVTFDGEDLENEYFTKDTHFWLDYIKPRMIIFNHFLSQHPMGMQIKNKKLEYDDVPLEYYICGEIKNLIMDDVGIKAQYVLYEKLPDFVTDKFEFWNSQLEQEHNYWLQLVKEWKDAGRLAFSSDAIKQLSKRNKDGNKNHIKSWAMAYVSLTHIPAEPRNNQNVDKLVADSQKSVDRQDNSNTNGVTVVEDNLLKDNKVMPTKKDIPDNKEKDKDVKASDVMPDEEEKAMIDDVEEKEGMELPVDQKQEEEVPYEIETEEVQNERVDMTDISQMLAELISMLKLEQTKATDGPMPEDKEQAMDTAEGESDTVENTYKSIAESLESLSKSFSNVNEEAPKGAGKYSTNNEDKEDAKAMKNVYVNKSGFGVRDDDQTKFVKAIRALRDRRPNMDSELKALGLIPASSGGYTTMVEQSNELIDLLLARSIFMRGGEAERLVDLMPMQSDTLTVPVLSSGGTAYWVGENSSITSSDPTFEQRTLVAKKLAMLIPISNELLADNSVQLENKLRETMVKIMMNSVDQTILFGAGVANQPLGVRNANGVTLTALNAAPTYASLVGAVQRLESANVDLDDSVAWIFNPREKATLRQIEDTAGHLIWTDTQYIPQTGASIPNSYLLGHKWVSSTNAQLGVGNNAANEGDIYLARWNDVIVGLRNDVEIQVSDVAGTAFQNDQTWIRAIMRMDVAVKHPESIEILTDVQT